MAEHRPTTLEIIKHHIIPIYCGGLDMEENSTHICDNTHRNVHEIHRPMWALKRVLSREIGQPWFSYRLAVQGIEWWHDRPDLRVA